MRAGERLPHLKAPVRTFSSEDPAADLYYREPQVMEGDKPLLNLADTTLNQRHNAENAMAAVLACRHLGIPAETAAEVLKEFTPPGHRCETVRTLDGVLWLNDSKATNLHALEAALKSQNSPVILIAGGKDKGLDYLPLRHMLKERCAPAWYSARLRTSSRTPFPPWFPRKKQRTWRTAWPRPAPAPGRETPSCSPPAPPPLTCSPATSSAARPSGTR